MTPQGASVNPLQSQASAASRNLDLTSLLPNPRCVKQLTHPTQATIGAPEDQASICFRFNIGQTDMTKSSSWALS